jgi:hypothetical protein
MTEEITARTGVTFMSAWRSVCSACGVFAPIRYVAPGVDIVAVTGWCAICADNSAYARTTEPRR